MRSFLVSLAALAALAVPLQVHAAEHPVMAATASLCISNHADPDKVAAAARAEGWQAPPPTLTVNPGETLLTRSVGDVLWMLSLRTQDNSRFGLPPSRVCTVSIGPGAGDIVASVQEFVGLEPVSNGEGGAALWYFVLKSGRREALPDTKSFTVAEALSRGPVFSIFARGGDQLTQVQYSEMAPWPKPTKSRSPSTHKR